MKIQFYRRDDFTSLAFVGERVMREFKKHHEVIEEKIGETLNPEVCDIGILYGLPQDLMYLKRHKVRYAGLVCEKELDDKDIKFIKKAELTEIWLPSKFCIDIYKKAGFENVRLVPHGIDEVPESKCLEGKVLMIYASYPALSWTTLRKNPFKAIEACQKLSKRIVLRTEKQRYYNKYNLENVKFVKYKTNLNALYDKCECILCPSDSEGFGLIGLEALARAIPLISTRTGNDYLEGMSYIHIDLPVTVEKIKEALENLDKNWFKYSNNALKQRNRILQKYSWDNVLKNIINL